MPCLSLLFALAVLQTASAITAPPSSAGNSFLNPRRSFSTGKKATCLSGSVPVSISTTNVKLALTEPANQTIVTEIFQELFQANSTIATRLTVGKTAINATYHIDTTLCLPANPTTSQNISTVQILTHGIGLDKSYWDIAPGYSHVDAAAAAGYATLAYNRLGVGLSDHPDPIQVVQSFPDIEIQHGLVQLLRTGGLGLRKFTHVVGVGHSYGSIVQLAQNAKYPEDVDAAVLTGFVNNVANLPLTVLSNNPVIASTNNPAKFASLPNSYLVHDTPVSVQQPFFRFPFFDQDIFENQYAAKDTYALGQQFTLPGIYGPAPAFTGPVDVVAGQHDFPFCLGECGYPNDQAAATLPILYPAASKGSQSFIVPNSGHYINAHHEAPQSFAQINKFLRANDL